MTSHTIGLYTTLRSTSPPVESTVAELSAVFLIASRFDKISPFAQSILSWFSVHIDPKLSIITKAVTTKIIRIVLRFWYRLINVFNNVSAGHLGSYSYTALFLYPLPDIQRIFCKKAALWIQSLKKKKCIRHRAEHVLRSSRKQSLAVQECSQVWAD